jgi:sialidase-1
MKTILKTTISVIVIFVGAWGVVGCSASSISKALFPWADGVIAYYSFDGNAQASTGNNATVHGKPKYIKTNSSINRAVEFDGIDDFIELPAQAHLLNGDFTVYLWVKYAPQTNGYGYGALFIQSTNPNSPWDGVSMFARPNLLARLDANHPLISTKSNMADNKWHCLALVKENNTLILYIDGELDNKITADHATISTLSPVFIGVNHIHHTRQIFKGAIDELRIYNRALKQETIQMIYKLNRDNLFK